MKVEELIRENPVLLFMKGTLDAPRCGFSMRVVQVLGELNVEYGAIDVLSDLEPLREATGEISDWRTFPQLYVNGELVAGRGRSTPSGAGLGSPRRANDQVVEDPPIFLEPEAAVLLDDKVLDANVAGDQVHFDLKEQT